MGLLDAWTPVFHALTQVEGGVALSWFEHWAVVQILWLVFLAVLARFAVTRFRARTTRQHVPASCSRAS
jgi:hypothetical protein